jgi:hypothetical protein
MTPELWAIIERHHGLEVARAFQLRFSKGGPPMKPKGKVFCNCRKDQHGEIAAVYRITIYTPSGEAISLESYGCYNCWRVRARELAAKGWGFKSVKVEANP